MNYVEELSLAKWEISERGKFWCICSTPFIQNRFPSIRQEPKQQLWDHQGDALTIELHQLTIVIVNWFVMRVRYTYCQSANLNLPTDSTNCAFASIGMFVNFINRGVQILAIILNLSNWMRSISILFKMTIELLVFLLPANLTAHWVE